MRPTIVILAVGTLALHLWRGPIAALHMADRAFVLAALGSLPLLIWGHWHAYAGAVWFLTTFGCATGAFLKDIAGVPIQMLIWAIGFAYIRRDGHAELHLELVPRWVGVSILGAVGAPIVAAAFFALMLLPLNGLWIAIFPLLAQNKATLIALMPWIMLGGSIFVLIQQGAVVEEEPPRPPTPVVAPKSGVFLPRAFVMAIGGVMLAAGLAMSAITMKGWFDAAYPR